MQEIYWFLVENFYGRRIRDLLMDNLNIELFEEYSEGYGYSNILAGVK